MAGIGVFSSSTTTTAANTMIPTIDLQRFPQQSTKLIEACEKWGCFRVINHKVSVKLMSDMKAVVRTLLDLPVEVKRENVGASKITNSGYITSAKNPCYESLGLYDLADLDSVDAFCTQLHASQHQRANVTSNARDIIWAYAQAIEELAVEIAAKIAEGLGIADVSFKDWPCLSRMNKYTFASENVGSIGAGEHTDTGFLTILQDDDNVGGLEVMDKTGNFVPVDPLPGAFLVNLGDVGAIWSNGRFFNVKHRVVCKEAKIRVSIATFFLGPRSANVEARKELITDESPPLYRPISYEDFRKLRVSKALNAGEALELLLVSSS